MKGLVEQVKIANLKYDTLRKYVEELRDSFAKHPKFESLAIDLHRMLIEIDKIGE